VVQVAPKRDTDVDHAEAQDVLARLERYITEHPGFPAPARTRDWNIESRAREDEEDDNDSIGLILAASAQPAALVCCLLVIFAFEHFNHGVATLAAFAAAGGTSYAILRKIPLSIACTVGILAGLAIARLS
jgi:hypothetical protein